MTAPTAEDDYARPRLVEGLADCYFYHTVDLPGLGEIQADWDLRGCVDDYLGRHDFAGQRALDVGTASGFLTFEMEKRGAEVVSFDMASGRQWDNVPLPGMADQWDALLDRLEASAERLKNSYWLTHRLLESTARACYGSIYEPLPASVGDFDVAVFGMIFTHLRDPFGALCSILPRVRGTVILTNSFLASDQPVAAFLPCIDRPELHAFWMPSTKCVVRMLEVLGFTLDRMVPCLPECRVPGHENTPCTAIVASRR